ncbi:coxsackievirus and adenovirus receptor homolog [Acanthopagrus latus]|uniref:coxsackievirus and adenovirus receptor homolog n=1 Tax=Acanthopagrus latus TaxID=8177 RepID=UPI00187BCCC2|nr:coxsackievirus and adenovirus receptor homolog [Acanthopagrus latus]
MMCVQLLVLVGTAAGLLTVPPVSCTADEVTVKTGEDATLPCQAHTGASITVIKWSRSEEYVFFFREKRSYENYQHPSFRGRVELRDPQKKEGDASVVLKNVTADDSGTYECVVSMRGRRRKRAAEFRRIVHLKVEDSGPKAGGNKDEGNKDKGNKDEGNKDEGNKDKVSKDEGNKDKVSKDEGNKDKCSAVLLGFSLSLLLVF